MSITPSDVSKWMNRIAYGVDAPGDNDKPTRARHTGLDQAKKAVSFCWLVHLRVVVSVGGTGTPYG